MQIPLLGEMTSGRLFFLFLFFYFNDSNSLGTWCTFGAGMLLSNLCDLLKQDKRSTFQLVTSAAVTFSVLAYSHIYLEQGRMMSFLTLQSLIIPLFKFKFCRRVTKVKPELDGRPAVPMPPKEVVEFDSRPLAIAIPSLVIFLYLWDGLSGLTSGVIFLIALPECTAKLPPMPNIRTFLFYVLVITLSSPIGLLVVGAVYYEKELLQAPPEYLSTAKMVLGARPESIPDYYAIVGVRRGADTAEIKRVFREASKLYHPDKTAGDPALQERFVQITEAVRKLTGKKTDREAYYKELQNAELQDMVMRSVYYCLLFTLWFVMTLLSRKPQPAPPAQDGQPDAGGGEAAEEAKPPKPSKPFSFAQTLWLVLSVPVVMGWIWFETKWAEEAVPFD